MDIVSWLTLLFGAGAFATGLYSIFYAHKRDKINVVLTNAEVDFDDIDEKCLYRFSIHNISTSPVIVSEVKAYREGYEVFDTGHEPSNTKTTMPTTPFTDPLTFETTRYFSGYNSENFQGETVIEPNDSISLSYYFEVPPNRINISVTHPKKKVFTFNEEFLLDDELD